MELRQQFLQQNFTPFEFDIYYLAIVLFFQALIRTLLRVNCHQFDKPLEEYLVHQKNHHKIYIHEYFILFHIKLMVQA